MRTFFRPGTISSLCIRIVQCVLSVVSLVLTYYSPRFAYHPAFSRVMITAMLLEAAWSVSMGIYDMYVLRFRKGQTLNSAMLHGFLICDSVVERTTLAATTMAAGVTITFMLNGFCKYVDYSCWRAIDIVSLTSTIWILNVISVSALHRVSMGFKY